MQEFPHLVYGLKRSEVRQVVKLLLYDGMLVSWKKSIERNERLDSRAFRMRRLALLKVAQASQPA